MRPLFTFLLTALAAVSPLVVGALPFVPTTDPSSSSTYWYQLRFGNYYAYALIEPYHSEIAGTIYSSYDDTFYWCFVGDETTGYRVYNRAAKKYLVGNVFGNEEDDVYTYYEAGDGDNFYLTYQNPSTGFYDKYYLRFEYFEGGQFYLDVTKGNLSYSVIEMIQGTPPLQCQRYDVNGVGYGFIGGGWALNLSTPSEHVHDHNAETKFAAHRADFKITIQADQPVALKQYSFVTADNARALYTRTPVRWKVLGSNDGNNWDLIDIRTDYPMPFANQEEVVFVVNDTREFTYFRLEPVLYESDNFYTATQLSEFWINEEKHNWQYHSGESATCGKSGYMVFKCSDCNVLRTIPTMPNEMHNYPNDSDLCSRCGTKKGVKKLLDNGQDVPYQARAFHGYRNSNETWPQQPNGWTSETFDDSDWFLLTLPTASPDHTGGPFTQMKYNSHWYGEYNYYLIRRQFELPDYNPNSVFTFRCIHDDNMEVCVNGYTAIIADGWTTGPENPNFENSAESFNIPAGLFHAGTNVVGIYIQQNWGGAYFDCELLMDSSAATLPGDVNGDNKVDVADLNGLINHLLGGAQELTHPDVNNDGKIDVADINAVINIMLQGN